MLADGTGDQVGQGLQRGAEFLAQILRLSWMPLKAGGPDAQRRLGQSERLEVVDDSRELVPGKLLVFLEFERIQHGPAPLGRAQIHDAGRGGSRMTDDAEVAGEVAAGQRSVRQDTFGSLP